MRLMGREIRYVVFNEN